MRLWTRRILLLLVVCFLAAQFVPVRRDNPATDAAKTIYASYPVSAEVHAVFDHSCRDCHSNETVWPWYSRVAPVSWLVASDVHDGRRHFNLSEWSKYPDQKKGDKLGEICDQVKNEDMPDEKYALLHRAARLSSADREMMCAWTEKARQSLGTGQPRAAATTTREAGR